MRVAERTLLTPEGPPQPQGPSPPKDAWPPEGAWPPWTAPLALVGGLVLAAVAGLVVDLPALALGVKVTSSHTPAGLALADTFVQDLAFVGAAVYCAHLGGRAVHSWHFGLVAPRKGWRYAAGGVLVLLAAFGLLSVVWSLIVSPGREKVLDQLGADAASAAVICVVAPMCEEMLFRGYIFMALRNWRGTLVAASITAVLFGGVHAGSAPVLDLVPLAALGFGLCLLYRRTGSLYPCMAAHSLNNSVAFASLAGLTFLEGAALALAALAGIALVVVICRRVGLIGSARAPAGAGA
ncbi:MAG TPA: type II CAAX endopeptidase family protein [Solirubrobacteraceae bacterium]|nr:type II CAAX endopeptidase family protein [Solirubrobacteraceae bacterium]